MTDPIAVALLKKIEIFSILNDEQCRAIAELLQGISIPAGTLVAKAGQHWSELSIILSGKVRLVEDRAPGKSYAIDILSDGAAFGEAMLFDEKPGEYSVYSLTELVLLKLRKERLQHFLRERPDIDELLKYFLAYRTIRNFVASSSLFANLSIEQLNLLVRSMVRQELAPGEILVRQRDQPLGLSIIESGRLRRYSERDATGSVVRLGRGDLVGEAPLLKRAEHDATVLAETDATAFFVHRAVFYSLVEEEKETTRILQRESDQRPHLLGRLPFIQPPLGVPVQPPIYTTSPPWLHADIDRMAVKNPAARFEDQLQSVSRKGTEHRSTGAKAVLGARFRNREL